MTGGLISVVISVYNEGEAVGRCLETVRGQSLQAKEIIIVDDGSTDRTGDEILHEIATPRRGGARNDVIVLRQKHRGAGAARNAGAARAPGGILVFGDADMRFHPKFLEELTEPIRKGKSKGTFSKSEFIGNWDNLWARFWNYQKGIYEPRAIPADYPETAPVFRAILKTEFDKAGGFDEARGYTDDWSLSEKLGYRATTTKAVYYHDNPASLREVFWQAKWAAKRKYKWGILGVLGNLVRGFPWRCPANEVVFYPVFWAVYGVATIIGAMEFAVFNKGYK
jgi:glycosyltransferase involved in cell wall biosynthesis